MLCKYLIKLKLFCLLKIFSRGCTKFPEFSTSIEIPEYSRFSRFVVAMKMPPETLHQTLMQTVRCKSCVSNISSTRNRNSVQQCSQATWISNSKCPWFVLSKRQTVITNTSYFRRNLALAARCNSTFTVIFRPKLLRIVFVFFLRSFTLAGSCGGSAKIHWY